MIICDSVFKVQTYPKMKLFLVILEILIFTTVSPKYQNSAYNIIQRIFDQCDKKYEVLRCLKLQAVKIADKAISTSKLGKSVYINLIHLLQNTELLF